ncbi:MAG: GbsR/MarR family transcriptional regulator [Clostridiales bacterium]|nr:GbsR/MarR family transcriptional regulator [Clostridiales bacterium]MCF8022026.1 GbsR/MarR family transcriptional regulator [Clostridiales bacterium]
MEEKEGSIFHQDKLNGVRETVINAIGETMDLYGVTPSTGRLFATMYFYEEPMSLDEMARYMGMSKTRMSTTARALLDIKMVEKVWQKGSRKDLYRARQDFTDNFIYFFCRSWRRERDLSMQAIKEVEPVYKELMESENKDIKEQARGDWEKLNEARKYFCWLDKIIDFFESGEIFKYVPLE